MPLQLLAADTKLARFAPALAHSPALFTWRHPVGGIGYSSNELYGDQLLRLEVDTENARVLRLVIDERRAVTKVSWNPHDLILHIHRRNGREAYREWVVTRSAIIRGITADPQVLAPTLKPELRHLSSPTYVYPQGALHSDSGFLQRPLARKKLVLPRVKHFLASRALIPRGLMRP